MENSKKKDHIKNIAIIFLTVMLLLTLFSNTIMNRSLVEVSTQMITSDTLTSKVRGSGYVESNDGYSVTISEARKIETVEVKTGATVEKGDVLFTLSDQDSDELKAKKDEVEAAQVDYETSVIDADLTLEARQIIEANNIGSLTAKQNMIAQFQDAYDAAVEEEKAATTAAANADANKAVADLALSNAQSKSTMAEDGSVVESEDVEKAKELVAAAESAQLSASYRKTQATDAVTAAKENLDAIKTALKNQISFYDKYTKLLELKQELKELQGNAVDAKIVAPISGTVSDIVYTAGQKTAGTKDAPDTMMTIQPENKAYILKFSITAEQSKKIQVGNEANIVNNWWGNDVHAKVIAIKKSNNDKNNVEVTCEVTGDDVKAGDNYTLSIGERSANYDLIVPTSAVREDSNGKYILSIDSKSTPLGNRYYARRVDVEVIASDDNNSAIAGAVEPYSYVITTTTKPVEPNQQVRLQE